MIKIKYTSFAFPPTGIRVGREYSFGNDAKGYFFEDVKGKTYMDIEEIKALFSPINGTWEDALKAPKASKKEDEKAN